MDQYAQESETIAVKQRFESFKFGQSSPTTPSTFSHGQSTHSRGSSFSSSFSNFSLFSTGLSSSSSDGSSISSSNSAKRNSHHRRRSSVSTRRESADIMGLAEPDLPHSTSEDNMNFGNKDSIRRRALWALEGKPDVAFNRVEIPELSTPDTEKQPFTFPNRPSFPAGQSAGSGMPINRDSFKQSLSSKEQLHTLLEEDEEEESSDCVSSAPVLSLTKPSPSRPRPATLVLRPLALAQTYAGLPTPTSPRAGLKTLSLNSPDIHPIPKRSSAAVNVPIEKNRRSSISYRKSSTGLATPEMTPSSDRRFSGGSSSDEDLPRSRPLSASEQQFLFKSHHALLARITDLERSLSSRPKSRPTSCISDASSALSDNDEMLQLVVDLKAERDELKRDADGWRQRVADLDKQVVLLSKRIDSERRDAWVARSQIGLVEIEMSTLEKVFETKRQEAIAAQSECQRLNGECNRLVERTKSLELEAAKGQAAEAECVSLRAQLQREKEASRTLQMELDKLKNGSSKAPAPFVFGRSHGFASVDSENSMTDVECDSPAAEFSLKSVIEEVEEDEMSEEDNGLLGYEDEEDSDENYGFSLGSEDDFNAIRAAPLVVPAVPVTPERPTHAPRASLSKTWTFPVGPRPITQIVPEAVDRFFECLGSVEDSSPARDISHSYESSKNLFTMGFKHGSDYFVDDDNDMPALIIPNDAAEVEQMPRFLDVVVEEDEDEDVTVASQKTVPSSAFDSQNSDDETSFNFGRPLQLMTPPASIPRASDAVFYSSPPSPTTPSSNAFVTPPNRRGGIMPSLIPVASPTKKLKTNSAKFIRHPQRKPVPAYQESEGSMLPHMNTSSRRSASDAIASTTKRTRISSLMSSVDMSITIPQNTQPASPNSFSSLMTSPLTPRLSFRTLTKFIPISSFLSPRADADNNDLNAPQGREANGARTRFVTRRQQLDKLQVRMKQERSAIDSSINICVRCVGDQVHL